MRFIFIHVVKVHSRKSRPRTSSLWRSLSLTLGHMYKGKTSRSVYSHPHSTCVTRLRGGGSSHPAGMYDSTPALSGADKVLKCRAPSHKAVSRFRHLQLLDCHRPAAPSLGSVRSRRTAHGTGITQLEAMTVVSATVQQATDRGVQRVWGRGSSPQQPAAPQPISSELPRASLCNTRARSRYC